MYVPVYMCDTKMGGARCSGSLAGVALVLKMTAIEQFVSKVVNFSSQYGTAGTSSYTATNLAEGPSVFPKYGDYTEAFVLVRFCVLQYVGPTMYTIHGQLSTRFKNLSIM